MQEAVTRTDGGQMGVTTPLAVPISYLTFQISDLGDEIGGGYRFEI